ncbi:hypothetical protein NC652_008794 [Populus alba x Populus x berolinensis]|nr:hypothetical protein NC652_008794 [Populus alba x Populus x berolinensis]
MEIEFPTAGLESVPGDGEGGIEMTGSMQLIREFCDRFVSPEKTTRTRIFFPEANEVKFARQSAFEGSSLKLDYLTKPSFFEDFGFVEKVKMTDRVKLEDELFLVAYPYFNVNEMLVVEELYKEAVVETARKLIIFNGELDRIRSGCATQVPGKSYEKLGMPTYVCINRKLCPPLKKLPWIFCRLFENSKNRTRATAEFSFSFNCCNEMNIKKPQLKIVKDELMFTAWFGLKESRLMMIYEYESVG